MGVCTHRVENAIDVERRVDSDGGIEDLVPQITTADGSGTVTRQREQALRREGNVLLKVTSVPAARRGGVEVRHKALAMVKRAHVRN